MHEAPNGKRYIGITKQVPEDRWQRGRGYKSIYFHNAIIKYGWDNIEHHILGEGLTKQEACRLEKEYISKYKSNKRAYGYNINPGGLLPPVNILAGEDNPMAQRVHQINKETGDIIATYGTMTEAAETLGFKRQGIGKACKGSKNKTYMGFIWEYADRDYVKPQANPIGRPPETAFKPVNLLDEEGNIIKTYKSIQEAAEDMGCRANGISKCCNGYLKTYKGRRWSHAALE